MFELELAASRARRGATGSPRGTGPASASRTSAIVRAARRVGALDVGLGLEVGVGEDRDRVLEVVEDDQHVGEHQRHVGQPERVGAGGSPSGSTVRTRS